MGEAALGVRSPRPLSQAILFTTFPEVGTPEEGAAFRRVAPKARWCAMAPIAMPMR
jgi:hypothetical protein